MAAGKTKMLKRGMILLLLGLLIVSLRNIIVLPFAIIGITLPGLISK